MLKRREDAPAMAILVNRGTELRYYAGGVKAFWKPRNFAWRLTEQRPLRSARRLAGGQDRRVTCCQVSERRLLRSTSAPTNTPNQGRPVPSVRSMAQSTERRHRLRPSSRETRTGLVLGISPPRSLPHRRLSQIPRAASHEPTMRRAIAPETRALPAWQRPLKPPRR